MEAEKKYRLTDRFLKDEEFSSEKNVIRGLDTATGGRVLIKRWESGSYRGINEIAQRSKMSFENITPFLCSFEEESYRYMVCKWAEGKSLEEYIAEGGTFEEKEALGVFYEICRTIVYLGEHENGPVIFNDLKPGNIIIEEKKETGGRSFSVKLIDFEACVRAGDAEKNKFRLFETIPVGSYFFSAPEVLLGKSTIFSDVYSAGAVLGCMLYGKDFYEKTEECLRNGKTALATMIRECMVREEPFKRVSPRRLLEKIEGYIATGTYDEEALPESEPEKEDQKLSERTETEKKQIEERKEEKKIKNVKTTENMQTEAQKQPKKEKKVSEKFKFASKLSVCTDDNLCFATELAYACAEDFKMKTLLVDSFTHKNRIKSFMLADTVTEQEDYSYGAYGLETCLFGDVDMWYKSGFIGKTEGSGNLFTGTKQLLEEIFSRNDKLDDFYAWAYKHFDALILNMYKNTCETIREEVMRLFDLVIIASEPNIDDLETACEHYTELSKKGKVYKKNVKYVAWDYKKEQSLPEKGITYLTGEDRYLGAISYDNERYRRRNTREKPEFYGKNTYVREEYDGILNKMLFGGEK